jgi:hypothetical protein
MREAVLPLAGDDEHLPKTVREVHEKYKGVSRILDEHTEILEAVHEDLKKVSHGNAMGKKGQKRGNGKKRRSVCSASSSRTRS